MPKAELVKTSKGDMRGFTQADEEARRKFHALVEQLEPGEFVTVKWSRPRNPKFHRKFFAMLNLAFEHWDPAMGRKRLKYKGVPIEKNFEQFRKDMLILAGYGIAKYDARGRVTMDAISIAFDKMESDEEFEKVYRAVQQVLLERVLHNYTRDDLDEVVEKLQQFGANNG